jgi:hypothetical protein
VHFLLFNLANVHRQKVLIDHRNIRDVAGARFFHACYTKSRLVQHSRLRVGTLRVCEDLKQFQRSQKTTMSHYDFDNTAVDDPIEADYFSDEGFAESVNTSYASSIASEIRRGIEENGRTYPSFGQNEYGLPIDEQEQDRNDLQHAKFLLILSDLHLAPIRNDPAKILDLGTGTGIWAM